jgi:hypothetical protein
MLLIFQGNHWEAFGLVLLPHEELTFYVTLIRYIAQLLLILKSYHAIFRDVVTSSAALTFIIFQIMGSPLKNFLA